MKGQPIYDIYSKRKPYGYGGKVKKYQGGGTLTSGQKNMQAWGELTANNPDMGQGAMQLGQMAGGALQAGSKESNMGAQMGGGALKGAMSGAALGPIGMAGGAVIGAISGGMKAGKAQQVEFQQETAEKMMKKDMQMNASQQYYNMYPAHGVKSAGFFARNGATIPNFINKYTNGGAIKLKGPSHGKGGIDMQVNGQPVEAEGGEVMYTQPNGDVTIFSKRIGPYSDKTSYAQLAEGMLAEGDTQSLQRLTRMQTDDTRANQSNNKAANGITLGKGHSYLNNEPDPSIPAANLGPEGIEVNNPSLPQDNTPFNTSPVASRKGAFTPKFGNATPFIDNVVNAALLNRTPNIPTPTLEKNVQLQTRPQISDQLAAIKTGNKRFGEVARQSLRGGGKRGALAQAHAKSLEMENQVIGNANRQQLELKNKQALINADVASRNAQKLDAYKRGVVDRTDFQNSQLSANAKNLTADMLGIRKDKALRNKDALQLKMVSKMFNRGLLERNNLTPEVLLYMQANPHAKEEDIARIAKKTKR